MEYAPRSAPRSLMTSTPDMPDEDLAAQVCTGDRAAFAALVERHLERTVAIARRVLFRHSEAEDIAQEVFLKFWREPELFQPHKAKFSTWLYRVIVNRALDVARKVHPSPLEEGFDIQDDTPSALEQIIRQERVQLLQSEMAALPARQRAALALSYQADMPDVEAAASLGIGLKAYESLLVRARRTLREKLLAGGSSHDDAG